MSITSILRNFNGDPNIVTIVCDNTLAEITASDYLLEPDILEDILRLQNGEFQWLETDLVLIHYSPLQIGFFTHDNTLNAFVVLSTSGELSATLLNGRIFVGNASNIATGVAVTGDIAVTNTGVTSIASNVIVNADINTAAAIAYNKLAMLPAAQILVGSAINVPTAVAMTGDVTISNTGVTSIAALSIVNADVSASAAIDYSKLASLPSANIIVGSAGNVATVVALTGDIEISNTGVSSIGSGVIVNADINASAAIDFSKLAPLTSANIIVGASGDIATSVAMTGDVTINNTGVTTIGASSIDLPMLSSGITPAAVIKFFGQLPTLGGSATEIFSIPGALAATDRAFVQIVNNGTGDVTVLQAVVMDDTLTITFSADPQGDTVFNYQLIRATS